MAPDSPNHRPSGAAAPVELIVVRHGQSTWNVESRFTGQADPPLSGLGRQQASDLARRCASLGIDAVAASDLVRASSTAAVVADELRLTPPVLIRLLRERWSHTMQGLTRDEIERKFPGQLAAWREARRLSLPGENEAYDEFADRVVRGLESAAEHGRRVLVVAHAGVFVVLDQLSDTTGGGHVANAEGRRVLVSAGSLATIGGSFTSGQEALRSGREDP
ncbi:MAG: histidine phosphatase family protein [Nocardioidaceae bacterium]|nr:histidine phosphatase family protein [Nocardioidaceae bacterium]